MKKISKKQKKVFKLTGFVFFLAGCFLAVFYLSNIVFAWVGPTQNPLGGNVDFQGACEYAFGLGLDYSD